ncbi:C-type lectin domain family 9 member A-like [Ctenodactylus gundi]
MPEDGHGAHQVPRCPIKLLGEGRPPRSNSPLQLLTLRGATGTSLVATSPATSAMHQEEIYTSLQWDDLPEEPSQRCLCSTKFPVVQLSATVTEQRETLTRRDREVLNFTLWTQNRALQIEYCQALVHTSVGADCKCSPCPDNWIRNGESCYRIVKDWKIWRLGQTDCLREGSSLLQIDSREELDFIVRSLPTHEGSHDYWVGVSQEGQSQRWLWQDGSSPHPDLLPKQSLQPADQACGYLRADSLFSADCNTWKYFICEKPTWRPTL